MIGRNGAGSHHVVATRLRRRATGPTFARHYRSDPMSRGGLALLVNTGLTGVLGFAYWIMAARLFSTYSVGAAGALVAATTLFAGIGQLNLSGMLMRFLPRAGALSRRLVVITYAFTACASASLAAVSLMGIKVFASPDSPLRLNLGQCVVFVAAVAATAIFTIEDSVLVGLRRAVWIPVENGAFGLAKIGILYVLAPLGTAFALFSTWMIPVALTIPVISAALFFRFLPSAPKYPATARLGPESRSIIVRFAIGDATGGLFTQAWIYLLPVLITASLGAPMNALYFTAFLFSSTLDQVANNYASPLTVEGAHDPDEIAPLIHLALRRIFMIMLPTVAVLAAMSHLLLRAFGESYVKAVPLLCLLLVACLPRAVSTVYYAYCRVQRVTHRSAVMQAGICVATISAVILLAPSFGLIGIGFAIIGIQSLAGIISWFALRRGIRDVEQRSSRRGRHRRPRATKVANGIRLPIIEG
jgi:O-antigen/teichoic acid export membrane protein